MIAAWLFDLLLCLGILGLAWRMLATTDLFQAVVLFIVFGLLLALAWARLSAPDTALAEAAIGAGLAGALLLATLAHLGSKRSVGPGRLVDDEWGDWPAGLRHLVTAAFVGLGLILLMPLWALREPEVGLRAWVDAHLDQSGVSHPVTAVLLNFRAWDTLLELGVLLLAILGAQALPRERPLPMQAVRGPVLGGAVRLLVPVLVMVAVYLLWLGSHAPGGAFQSGAVLGAGLVLLVLARPRGASGFPEGLLRLFLAMGLLVFLALAVAVMALSMPFLGWPVDAAGPIILLIEAFATVAIAVTLAALFMGQIREGE